MRFLFCSEFYFPSIGGVQEVMRHIAERLVREGHDVTVATSWLENRDFDAHNGVKIKEFSIAGNHVRGLAGEVDRFEEYITSFDGDAILIKAAQQWTFDATWNVLDKINVRKVFIPCGFSGLYEPSYKKYFEEIPAILRKFDHLIFYAEHYRDVDFARQHQINHFSIIPNGACEIEFDAERDPTFRKRHNIPESAFLLLTVGSFTGMKGHRELVDAMALLNKQKREIVLILNGNQPPTAAVQVESKSEYIEPSDLSKWSLVSQFYKVMVKALKRFSGLAARSIGVLKREGVHGVIGRFVLISGQYCPRVYAILERLIPAIKHKNKTLFDLVDDINASGNQAVKIHTLDLPRPDLVQAYKAADLFVFASNIEYSPLVLFESAAAGTPFLTVPVGNAKEIANWTGGGIICPADKDDFGYTRVKPATLAEHIVKSIDNSDELNKLGERGYQAWKEKYSWQKIAKRYETVLLNNL